MHLRLRSLTIVALACLSSLDSCAEDVPDGQTVEAPVSITPLTASGDALGLPDWSSDGEWIAFTRGWRGSAHIWIVPPVGGEARQVTTTPDTIHSVRWSPASDRLAFISSRSGRRNIWTMSPFEGESALFRVTTDADSVDCCAFAWSPSGAEIAFTSLRGRGNTNIWAVPSGGGTARQVTDRPGNNWDPSWSPDGEWIAFNSVLADFAGATLWIVPAVGGTARQLTAQSPSWRPRWSPNGEWIAFESYHGPIGAWIVRAIGGTPFPVTVPGHRFSGMAWSPDGTRIAGSTSSPSWEIRVVPMSGGQPAPLIPGGFQTASLKGAWSPDDTRYAFVESGPEGDDIWTVSLATGERRQVTVGGALPRTVYPDLRWSPWSPDSKRIAYSAQGPDGIDIWTIPSEGGTPERVTVTPGREQKIDWSPNGETLAFTLERDGGLDIWTVPASGGRAEPLVEWPGRDDNPVWSPDGRSIAFTSDARAEGYEGEEGIWVLTIDSGQAAFLAGRGGGVPAALQWSPDGTEIFYATNQNREIWKVPVTGEPPEHALDVEGAAVGWSADGSRILVARQQRDVAIADVRALLREASRDAPRGAR